MSQKRTQSLISQKVKNLREATFKRSTLKLFFVMMALVSLFTYLGSPEQSGAILILQIIVTSALYTALFRYVISQVMDVLSHPVFEFLHSPEIGLATKLKLRLFLYLGYLIALFVTYVFGAEMIVSMYNV